MYIGKLKIHEKGKIEGLKIGIEKADEGEGTEQEHPGF